MGLTRISWILKVLGAGGRSRSGFCWKLLESNGFLLKFSDFLLKFIGFYWNLLNFLWNLLEFIRNPLEFNRFYWKFKENHCNPYWFTKHFLFKTIKKQRSRAREPRGTPHFSPIVASWNPLRNASFCQRASFAGVSRPTLGAMKLYGKIASRFWRRLAVFARSKKISWGVDGHRKASKLSYIFCSSEKMGLL